MAIPASLCATYGIVTPGFMAGVRGERPELRPPSIDGLLRFWWRAITWSKVRALSGDDDSGLQELRRRESLLFGTAALGQRGGQGCFILSVESNQTEVVERADATHQIGGRNRELGYLLGQGLWHFRNGVTRDALTGHFAVRALFRPSATQDDMLEVAQAMWLLGTLGGMGARSRRGWGSLVLQEMTSTVSLAAIPDPPADEDALRAGLQNVLEHSGGLAELPPYSAFFAGSRVDLSVFESATSALDALSAAGGVMLDARSFYPDGLFRPSARAGTVARMDHDAVYEYVNGGSTVKLPQRAVFGLPHNYSLRFGRDIQGRGSKPASVNIAPLSRTGEGRRASPLLIHAHRFSDGRFAVVQILFPALFYPADQDIQLKVGPGNNSRGEPRGNKRDDTTRVPNGVMSMAPIGSYLDSFPARTPLWPTP